MQIIFWILTAVLAFWLLIRSVKRAGDWVSAWLDSDHDPETGAPVPREPLGRALLRSLREPGEKRRQEREELRRRQESLSPEERRFQNPYGRDVLLSLLGFLLPILCFLACLLLLRPLAAGTDWERFVTILLWLLLIFGGGLCLHFSLLLIANAAGYFQFLAYRLRHPAQPISRAEFEAMLKAQNGSYRPEDLGR